MAFLSELFKKVSAVLNSLLKDINALENSIEIGKS